MFLLLGLLAEVHNQILGERLPATDGDLALHVATVIIAVHDKRGTTIRSVCVKTPLIPEVPCTGNSTFNCIIDECRCASVVAHGRTWNLFCNGNNQYTFFSLQQRIIDCFLRTVGGRVVHFLGGRIAAAGEPPTTLPRTMRYC